MTRLNLYTQILENKKIGKKSFAVLIDPDILRLSNFDEVLHYAIKGKIDYFFVGGSLILEDALKKVIDKIRSHCNIPCILFPGNSFQLTNQADGLLFLSLISGRNPDLLIGKHVMTAPMLKKSPVEIMSTGYMLIDGGIQSTVQYMSNTNPIPANKNDIAVCTALAAELLGFKLIFMDAGSGAIKPIDPKMITAVNKSCEIPLIVGGGIKSAKEASLRAKAGADIIVVGNAIESNPALMLDISDSIKKCSKSPTI